MQNSDVHLYELSKTDFKILFVDDEKQILNLVRDYLQLKGYNIAVCDSGIKALEMLKEDDYDIVCTDLNMPRFSGLELLAAVKEFRQEIEVVIVTGYATIDTAIKALKLGSYDYIQKPINMDRLMLLINRIIDKMRLQKENYLLRKKLKERYSYGSLVGASSRMRQIYEVIDRMRHSSPTVLIRGESGTGKEVVAKIIHETSDRANKPFIPVNCGAIVDGLIESELFGHVKGSFTGAIRDKEGLFKMADGGAIFLDEIAEVSPPVQVKLLRALQERQIRPVGGNHEIDIDVRIMTATNKDLQQAIREGELREDLFYRLNVVSIDMPPLRMKKEDIPLLVQHFIEKFNMRQGRQIQSVTPEAMDKLLNYQWPGNVRQLENAIERAFALGVSDAIEPVDLPMEITGANAAMLANGNITTLREAEITLIRRALIKTNGNKAEAAKLLGINTTTVYRKMEKYDIQADLPPA